MDGVALQTEAHEDGLQAEDLLKRGDDGDAAATAHGQGLLAEGDRETSLGGLVSRQIDGADVRLAAVLEVDLHPDARRGSRLQVINHHARDALRILMRHEAARQLGVSLGRQDRLRALARVAAPDAADVERRPAAVALQRRVALLAEHLVHVDGPLVGLLVEGHAGDHRLLVGRKLLYIVIEMRQGDAPVRVGDAGDELAERIDRVGHGAAEVARMEVAVGAGHFDLPVRQPAQTRSQRGRLGAHHAGVRDEDHVRPEQLAMRLAEGDERFRPDLLLALEDELHVAMHRACVQGRLEALGLDHGLALVVVSAAGIDASVANGGLERLALPKLQRLGGHDVVMPIDEHRGQVGRHDALGVDHRIAAGGHHLGAVGSGR